jgi:hypothetical protein
VHSHRRRLRRAATSIAGAWTDARADLMLGLLAIARAAGGMTSGPGAIIGTASSGNAAHTVRNFVGAPTHRRSPHEPHSQAQEWTSATWS